jgi:hypothetical protein
MDHQVFKLVTQVAMVAKQILTMIVQYAIHLTSEKYGLSSVQTCGTSNHGNKTSIKAQLSIPNHQVQVSKLHP